MAAPIWKLLHRAAVAPACNAVIKSHEVKGTPGHSPVPVQCKTHILVKASHESHEPNSMCPLQKCVMAQNIFPIISSILKGGTVSYELRAWARETKCLRGGKIARKLTSGRQPAAV